MVFPKIGISRFFGISCKNWDFRQNIWILGACRLLKSPKKRPEIRKNARNPNFCEIPIFGKPHGKGPEESKSTLCSLPVFLRRLFAKSRVNKPLFSL